MCVCAAVTDQSITSNLIYHLLPFCNVDWIIEFKCLTCSIRLVYHWLHNSSPSIDEPERIEE